MTFGLNFHNPGIYYFAILMSAFIIYTTYFKRHKKLEYLLGLKKRDKFHIYDLFLLLVGAFQFIGMIYLSVAAGNPVEYKKNTTSNKEVRDLFFVVDVSRSMLADDFSPNRLEVAKNYIREFIDLRSSDRIGLNIFAEKIITLSPLTLDHSALRVKVDDISVGFLGNGTNIGDALALAVSRLEKSESQEKVAILLTDGVSNAGSISPEHAGKIAQTKKVKVYGIGIGTEGDAFLPYRVGNRVMKQRIPGGNIDHDVLEKISNMTNGKYFKAVSEKALRSIFNEINMLERSSISIDSPNLIKYNYKRYLVIGLFILLLCELLRIFLFRFAL